MTNAADSTPPTIAELLKAATPEAAAQLRSLADSMPDKDTRKAAKRALYLLSQRGILPPEAPAASTGALEDPKSNSPLVEAYASAFDGAGNRLLFFVLPNPDGGSPTVVQILLNDETGVMDVNGLRMPRREVETRLASYMAQLAQGLALAPVALDAARQALRDARAINTRLSRRTPSGFQEWAARIGEPEAAPDTSLHADRPSDAELLADASLNRDALTFFTLPWFEAWFFPAESAYPWITAWSQTQIMDDAEAKTKQEAEIVSEALPLLFSAEALERYAARLEVTADILLRREQTEAARQAFYHALTLRESASLTENPFARVLVQRTIEAALDLIREQQFQNAAPPSR